MSRVRSYDDQNPEMMEMKMLVKNVRAELIDDRVRLEIGRSPQAVVVIDLDVADARDLASAITEVADAETDEQALAEDPKPEPAPPVPAPPPAPALKTVDVPEVGVRLLSDADKHRRRLGFTVSDIADAVFDPQKWVVDDRVPSRLKCVGGSGVGVVVSFGERIPVVLTVRPGADFSRDFKGSQSWRRGGGGGSTKRVPKSLSPSQLTARLSDMGVSVELSAGHYVVKNGHGQVTFASTPSDHRWLANTISRLRLLLGIDLREDI